MLTLSLIKVPPRFTCSGEIIASDLKGRTILNWNVLSIQSCLPKASRSCGGLGKIASLFRLRFGHELAYKMIGC